MAETETWRTTVLVEHTSTSFGWSGALDVLDTLRSKVAGCAPQTGSVGDGLDPFPKIVGVKFERVEAADDD